MKRKRANIQTSGNAPSGNALPDPTAFAALRRESEGREIEGREIEAMWEGDGQWYPAVVIALSTSTVTVRFEDGIVQETLKEFETETMNALQKMRVNRPFFG